MESTALSYFKNISFNSPKTVILHVGTHKTGTSSIQTNIENNLKLLDLKGIQRPDQFYKIKYKERVFSFNLCHPLIAYYRPKSFESDVCQIEDEIEFREKFWSEFHSSWSGHHALISHESLFTLEPDQIADLKSNLQKYFDKFIVVIYLREQQQWIESWQAERITNGSATEREDPLYIAETFPILYSKYIGDWANSFGEKSIILRIFDRGKLFRGDVVADFFNLMQIDQYHKIPDVNIRPLNRSIHIIGHINKIIGRNLNANDLIEWREKLFQMLYELETSTDKAADTKSDVKLSYEWIERLTADNKMWGNRFLGTPTPFS